MNAAALELNRNTSHLQYMSNNQLGQSVIRNKDQIMQHVNRFYARAFHGFLKGERGREKSVGSGIKCPRVLSRR